MDIVVEGEGRETRKVEAHSQRQDRSGDLPCQVIDMPIAHLFGFSKTLNVCLDQGVVLDRRKW